MSMPETTMNEDHAFQAGENQIRLPWKSGGVKAIPEAESVHEASNREFRLGVLPSDAAHPFAALLRGKCIHVMLRPNRGPLKHCRPWSRWLQPRWQGDGAHAWGAADTPWPPYPFHSIASNSSLSR
jgi:hypothetical protein